MSRTIEQIEAELQEAYDAESAAYRTCNECEQAEIESAEAAWQAAWDRINALEVELDEVSSNV
ncbi:hypothetical protein EBT25_16590 [bacterium]|nr:hypothetical protein [bacterium]